MCHVIITHLQEGRSVMKCKSVIKTHSKTVSRIVIQAGLIVTAGQDCVITVIRIMEDGAVTISHVLQVSGALPSLNKYGQETLC